MRKRRRILLKLKKKPPRADLDHDQRAKASLSHPKLPRLAPLRNREAGQGRAGREAGQEGDLEAGEGLEAGGQEAGGEGRGAGAGGLGGDQEVFSLHQIAMRDIDCMWLI